MKSIAIISLLLAALLVLGCVSQQPGQTLPSAQAPGTPTMPSQPDYGLPGQAAGAGGIDTAQIDANIDSAVNDASAIEGASADSALDDIDVSDVQGLA